MIPDVLPCEPLVASDPAQPAGPLSLRCGWPLFLVLIGFAVLGLALPPSGGGLKAVGQFLIFLLCILFPGASLYAALLGKWLPRDVRAITCLALMLLTLIPLYFVRKGLPWQPAVTDACLIAILLPLACRYGNYLDWCRQWTTPEANGLASWLFGLIGIVTLVQLGMAAEVDGAVRYFGMVVIDFTPLAGVTATIKNSPGLPEFPVPGMGPLHYHWLYFAVPAYLGDFLGPTIPCTTALLLANLIPAGMLIATVLAVIRASLGEHHPRWIPHVAAGIVLLTPSILYVILCLPHPVQYAVDNLFPPPHAMRNTFLLAPLASMLMFGNNTLALVCVLLVTVHVRHWNREPSWQNATISTLLLTSVGGLSVTLCFSLLLAVVVWFIAGLVKHPLRLVLYGAPTALAVASLLFGLGLFGDSGSGLGIAFDNGLFIRNMFIRFLPVTWLCAWAFAGRGSYGMYLAIATAGLVVPTLLYISDSEPGQYAFSLKTASLIVVACSPLVASGLEYIAAQRSRFRWLPLTTGLLCGAGAVCTAGYVLQYPYYRFVLPDSAPLVLPNDYFAALTFVRDNSPPTATVLDACDPGHSLTIPAVFVAERRVFVPSSYLQSALGGRTKAIQPRLEAWERWRSLAYSDEALGSYFATSADYLLVEGTETIPSWKRVFTAGSYGVFVPQHSVP